jgi:hypothetical protein
LAPCGPGRGSQIQFLGLPSFFTGRNCSGRTSAARATAKRPDLSLNASKRWRYAGNRFYFLEAEAGRKRENDALKSKTSRLDRDALFYENHCITLIRIVKLNFHFSKNIF